MFRKLICLLAASLLSAPAATIYNNGAPLVAGVRDISLFRSADDFVLAAGANVAAVRFWISTTDPIQANPETNFSAAITYAIYANNAGSLGAVLASGTVTGLTSMPTGQSHSGSNAGMNVLDFDLVSPVALAAGTYWLELHEGLTLGTSDGSNIGWETSAGSGGNAKQGFAVNGVPTGSTGNELAFQLFDTPFQTAATPEPGTLAVAALALVAMGVRRRQNFR